MPKVITIFIALLLICAAIALGQEAGETNATTLVTNVTTAEDVTNATTAAALCG